MVWAIRCHCLVASSLQMGRRPATRCAGVYVNIRLYVYGTMCLLLPAKSQVITNGVTEDSLAGDDVEATALTDRY